MKWWWAGRPEGVQAGVPTQGAANGRAAGRAGQRDRVELRDGSAKRERLAALPPQPPLACPRFDAALV